MNKEKILGLIKELVCYSIVLIILLLIANKLGWTNTSIWDNFIGLTIGWLIWRLIMLLLNKCQK